VYSNACSIVLVEFVKVHLYVRESLNRFLLTTLWFWLSIQSGVCVCTNNEMIFDPHRPICPGVYFDPA